MGYYETLPLVKAKTSLMVSNNITGTINKEIERVYDFIVAEDVVLNFLKDEPAILNFDSIKQNIF